MAKYNSTSILNDGFKATFQRIKADTKKHQDAVDRARDRHYPNRSDLVRIYFEIAHDNHLTAVIEQRLQAVLSSDFCVYNTDNSENEIETEMLNADWFFKLLKVRMMSIFYGSKLIEVSKVVNNEIEFIEIPQEFYIPEKGEVTKYLGAFSGQSIYEKPYNRFLLPVFEENLENIGLVSKAVPMLLFKKNSFIYWQSYLQTFGTPLRKVEYDGNDIAQKNQLEESLKNSGNKPYIILPSGAKLEYVTDMGKTDVYNLYLQHSETMNKEVSKLILGTTMTVDDGSSRSQSEVHQEVVNMFAEADKRNVQFWVNGTLKPFLANLGINITGTFKFKDDGLNEANDLAELNIKRASIVDVLGRNGFVPTAEWVTETLGVPVKQMQNPNEVQKKKIIP